MQPDVGTLFLFNMDGYLRTGLQVLAGRQFIVFQVRPDDVVGFSGGHTLGKFAPMVGKQLPTSFLLPGAADLHFDAINGVAIGIVDGSEDECIVAGRSFLMSSA
jgi:hypothetical protein